MKLNYFDNLIKTLTDCNEIAYRYGDGKAWDNRKKKIFKRHAPRGKVYMKLSKIEGRKLYNKLVDLTDRLEEIKTEH